MPSKYIGLTAIAYNYNDNIYIFRVKCTHINNKFLQIL